MADKIIAYRLAPVYEIPPGGIAAAAVMTCLATGKVLSGSGGGGEFLSPLVVAWLRSPEPQIVLQQSELVTLLKAAKAYADDLESGLADGTYDDRADLDAVRETLSDLSGFIEGA